MGDDKKPTMLGIFEGKTLLDVLAEFEVGGLERYGNQPKTMPACCSDIELLLAYYTDENYSGDAFVLFRRGGELFEVNGGHCSCNGLEGQWTPELTSAEALRYRMEKGTLGRASSYEAGVLGANEFADELAVVLDGLETVH